MPTKPERTLTPRQRRLAVGAALLAVTVIGLTFVLFFPLRTIFAQRRQASEISKELTVLRSENGRLQSAADRLQSNAEIERLARSRFHLVFPGETAYVAVPAPAGTPPITFAPTTTTTVPPTTTTVKPATTTTKPGATKSGTTKSTTTTKPHSTTTTTH